MEAETDADAFLPSARSAASSLRHTIEAINRVGDGTDVVKHHELDVLVC
jgi:hypothetical protein